MARLRAFIGLKHAVVVSSAILILAFGSILLHSSYRTGKQIVADSVSSTERIARVAEVTTEQDFLASDALLQTAAKALAGSYHDAPIDGLAIRALLRQLTDQSLLVRDILILDETGLELNSATFPTAGGRRFSQRDLMATNAAGRPSEMTVGLSPPGPGAVGRSLFLSRPLILPDGRRGVIAAELPVESLREFFASIGNLKGLRIALLSDNGTLLASESPNDPGVGRSDALAAPVLARSAVRDDRSFEVALPTGDAIVSYRRIAGKAMLIAVAVDKNELLSSWRGERREQLAIFVVIAISIGALSWGFVRLLDRRQHHLDALHRNEAKLAEQSALLQSTLEHMGEGLGVFDREHRLLAWNDRFISLLGLPAGVGFGTRMHDILRLQARRGDFGPIIDVEREVRQQIELIRRGEADTTERTTSHGRILEIRRRRMPYGGVVMLFSDITERKRTEQETIRARNTAEIANRSKSEFLANMSHELRTPLNAIIGFSDIIQNQKFGAVGNAKYLEYVVDIHTSGIHLLDLINDVLDMSKIEAGRLELFEEEVAVGELVTACLTMVRERARERRIRITADPGAAAVMLWADQRAMKQILLNLLSNAVKFSRDGGTVTITSGLDGEGGVMIQVADSGIGMTPEQIVRARQPFGQAHASTTNTYGGTGLGLPITQRLAELHGGELFIDSRAGEGTVVSIVLPPSRTRGNERKRA
jgi:signal transduction histidine kinase